MVNEKKGTRDLLGIAPLNRAGMTGCVDIQRIDRELDHLRALGQFGFLSGFAAQPFADVRPTALALHLYVRAQGSLQSPVEYFGVGRSGTKTPP
jgi:hypothetical protein